MHQERNYPGRVSGTDLVNPDFAALARSFGATASGSSGARTCRARSTARSLQACPAVLHLPVDPEALTPRQTLSEIRDERDGSHARTSPAAEDRFHP